MMSLSERSHDPGDYVQIKASDLEPGKVFYRRSEDGIKFDSCYPPEDMSSLYAALWRQETKRLSIAGRLYKKR